MTTPDPENQDLQPLAEIDRVIHEPARLAILGVLAAVDSADFLFVHNQTGLTGGNLSSHMTRLEEAGYVEVTKEFVDRIPRTLLRATKKGRAALRQYRQSKMQVSEGCRDSGLDSRPGATRRPPLAPRNSLTAPDARRAAVRTALLLLQRAQALQRLLQLPA